MTACSYDNKRDLLIVLTDEGDIDTRRSMREAECHKWHGVNRSAFGAILHAQCKQLRYISVAGKQPGEEVSGRETREPEAHITAKQNSYELHSTTHLLKGEKQYFC